MSAENQPYREIVITAVRAETPGVKTFSFVPADGGAFSYRSGQFITLVFNRLGREERRSFSLCTSPDADSECAFSVKRLDNGAYSRFLIDQVAAGDRLLTTGAAGLFTLPGDMNGIEQVFFLAAGIGITPILPLLTSLLHTQPGIRAVLLYSNRTQAETVFYSRLQQLAQQYPLRLSVEYLLSTSFNLARARLSKQLLRTLVAEYGQTSPRNMLFYVCGPFAYMRMVVLALGEMQIGSSQIKKENFNTNDRVVKKTDPPDKGPHTVTLIHEGQEHRITVQYPETLLQAARRQGLSLAFSCEVGRCGSCTARCVDGKVWLSYNEVLTDADLARGMILTCVAHPIDGDAVVEV